jgi:anhydro-N-acetylmuramic acid kinase
MDASRHDMMQALGLMSGTSFDGVDVALVTTDGETIAELGPVGYRPYADSERVLLRQALAEAVALRDRTSRPGILAEAEALVTSAHAEAVQNFLREHAIEPGSVGVVGFHGQTVLHRPAERLTVQLGDGATLAARLGILVVYDFRAADVTAGGEGAPFVPVVHRAFVQRSGLDLPALVINLGGVGNLTYVGEGETLIAFDTGPANALLDDFVLRRTGQPFDRDGALAQAGRPDAATLVRFMDHPYFARPAPKSLDRNDFASASVDHLSTEDGAATLVAFTAESIGRGVDLLPSRPRICIAAGGGARNPALLDAIAARLGVPVRSADDIGWSAEALEAQAFAILAVRSLRGLPLSYPGTTGVPEPTTGGVLAKP